MGENQEELRRENSVFLVAEAEIFAALVEVLKIGTPVH